MTRLRSPVLRHLTAAGFALVLLAGCPAPPPAPPPAKAPPASMAALERVPCPRFEDDLGFAGLEEALAQSIAWLKRQPPERGFSFGPDHYPAAHLLLSLERFRDLLSRQPPAGGLEAQLEADYLCYHATGRDGDGQVLYTGYYEPVLEGRLEPHAEFRHPVWGRPEDLITVDLGEFAERLRGERIAGRLEGKRLVPYPERRDIEERGLLYDRARPLAWVRDPVGLFFLHVQGSGKIALENGTLLQLAYDGANGRPYRSIGRLLIAEGKIAAEEMSLPAIRRYLADHPQEIPRVLYENPSYIFFRVAPEGPLGALGVRLTAGRSLALDRTLFPEAALAFAVTRKPSSGEPAAPLAWVEARRFLLVQDTGSAITGPGRADLFWGTGPEAELAAGGLKHPGLLYLLVLRPERAPP